MVEIKQQLVPAHLRKATYGTGNPIKKMVIHQTGNTAKGAGAQTHANLQSRGYSASWHIQSDDKEIIQSWPFTYKLWHASTLDAPNGGNMVGIGWEICINSDGDYLKSLEIAAQGIGKVMKQEGIPMSQLTTHNAEDPKNKYCPAQILSGKDGVNWDKFKAMVQKAYDGNVVSAPSTPSKPATPKPTLKSNAQVAQEVLAGKWGNNPQREQKLKAAGYNASAIQAEVNKLAGGPSAPAKPAAKAVNVGSRVTLKSNASKYATGENIPSSVKNKTYTVQQKGTRNGKTQVLLKEIVSWVWESDVQ